MTYTLHRENWDRRTRRAVPATADHPKHIWGSEVQ